MIHLGIINDKETVVGELARPDVDGWILVIELVQVQLKLGSDALRIDSGRYSRLPFAKHEQYALINIVVNQDKGTLGRPDKFRGELIGIEDLAIEENTLNRRKGSTDEEVDLLVMFCNRFLYLKKPVIHPLLNFIQTLIDRITFQQIIF